MVLTITRRIAATAATLICALAFTACGENNAPAETPDELTGVITDIHGETIADIEGFSLKAGDETYDITIEEDIDLGFPLSHLHEHLASSDPVVVDLEKRGDELVALSIEDA